MGVTWWIRNVTFSFFGGYAMTSFYNDAVRLGRLDAKKRVASGMGNSHGTSQRKKF
eukprot:CAMPEP_0174850606 /NCGR_PEP_ID=MMETSP1114-20130205/20351_1 /TAXON_ID=312471 /ORGANISM="Neobodo designis, Strain CCAP 1951/1" /LENGTH=55 /DNA_ID=CAMNT_0016085075 /DNA_START=51 /DNA_END=215 /DNA_ORIENTATION=-